jgi:hypothetical protein
MGNERMQQLFFLRFVQACKNQQIINAQAVSACYMTIYWNISL